MKLLLSSLALFAFQGLFSQNASSKTTIFNNNKVAVFNILEKNINNPSGGTDSILYAFEVKQINDNVYSCQIINELAGSSEYNINVIKNIVLLFQFNSKQEIILLSKKDSINYKVKKDVKLLIGKDTSTLGPYYYMLYNADLLLKNLHLKYLKQLQNYIDYKVDNNTKEIFIPNITDSMPANLKNSYSITVDSIIIKSDISLDSTKVRAYLYSLGIKKYGEMFKETFKEKDMIYTPTTITTTARGHKKKSEEIFVINHVYYQHKFNLGNPFDRIHIIEMKKTN